VAIRSRCCTALAAHAAEHVRRVRWRPGGLPTHSGEGSEITVSRRHASLESDAGPTFQVSIVERDTVTSAGQDQHYGGEQLVADMGGWIRVPLDHRAVGDARGLLFYRLLQQAAGTDPHPLSELIGGTGHDWEEFPND
jgi:hypothetical protein